MPLKRILDIPDVDTEVLFETDLSNILFTDIRKMYSKVSIEGKLCRKILKKYQQLCLMDPRLRNEELPPISDVSDDEVFQEPIRSFGSLFHGNRRSVLCSGSDVIRENTSLHCESPANVHLASL